MTINKLITIFICVIVSSSLLAHGSSASGELEANENQQLLNQSKLPVPGSGVTIIPLSKMYPVSPPENLLSEFKEQNEKGFIQAKSSYATTLLSFQSNKFFVGSEKTYLNNDPYDTHLKKSLSQIKLAFENHPISFIKDVDIIGFAAAGTYNKGWTGVSETFNTENLGVCKYIKHNFQITQGAVTIAEEFVSYDINSKPTVIFIQGNKDTGYLTQIAWYDPVFSHTLQCANKNFKRENTSNAIELAKKIDLDL